MIWSWYIAIEFYSYFMNKFHIYKIILFVYINYILGTSKEYNNIYSIKLNSLIYLSNKSFSFTKIGTLGCVWSHRFNTKSVVN